MHKEKSQQFILAGIFFFILGIAAMALKKQALLSITKAQDVESKEIKLELQED